MGTLITPSYPPPPVHPTTHRRLIGAHLPLIVRTPRKPRRQRPGTLLSPPHPRLAIADAIETVRRSGWTMAAIRATGRPAPILPRRIPRDLALVFVLPGAPSSWATIVALCARWSPLAVLSRAKPPAAVYAHTSYVWRLTPVLPPTHGPDLLALTTPDPRALASPRLHCWVVPPLTDDSPSLSAWIQVLAARPEVPILMDSPWHHWATRLHTLTLLRGPLLESLRAPLRG